MKQYRIQLTKSAEKSILKIHQSLPSIGNKISTEIEHLKKSPFAGIKLAGADGNIRRIRVGDYRIIYEVHNHILMILVVYIGPRGGAY